MTDKEISDDRWNRKSFRDETFQVTLSMADIFLLGFFLQVTGGTADRVYHGIVDPGVDPLFWSRWSRLSDLIQLLHLAHGRHFPFGHQTMPEKEAAIAEIQKLVGAKQQVMSKPKRRRTK